MSMEAATQTGGLQREEVQRRRVYKPKELTTYRSLRALFLPAHWFSICRVGLLLCRAAGYTRLYWPCQAHAVVAVVD